MAYGPRGVFLKSGRKVTPAVYIYTSVYARERAAYKQHPLRVLSQGEIPSIVLLRISSMKSAFRTLNTETHVGASAREKERGRGKEICLISKLAHARANTSE